MAKRVKIINVGGGREKGIIGRYGRFQTQRYLESIASCLAGAVINIPADLARKVGIKPGKIPFSRWTDRVGQTTGTAEEFLLTIDQREQGLLNRTEYLDTRFKLLGLLPEGAKPEPPAGLSVVKTAEGWRLFEGEFPAALACGYGAPDPGTSTSFTLRRYLGIARQVWWAGLDIMRNRKKWQDGQRIINLYDEVKDVDLQANCKTFDAFAILDYTPAVVALKLTTNIYLQRFS